MKAVIIRNPVAGRAAGAKAWLRACEAFQRELGGVEIHETRHPGDAVRLARELAEGAYDVVIAAGGDGTVGDVVEGVLSSARPDMPVAVIPVGTGCDFALPEDFSLLARHIRDQVPRAVDVGMLIGLDRQGHARRRCFANAASLGISGEIVTAVNARARQSWLGGPRAFFLYSVLEILRYRPYEAEILVDGLRVHQGPLALAVMANGSWCGGGMHMVPQAALADGWLHLAIIREDSRLRLLRLLKKVYTAEHVKSPQLTFHRARRIEIRPQDVARFPLEADGEMLAFSSVSAEVLPGALVVKL